MRWDVLNSLGGNCFRRLFEPSYGKRMHLQKGLKFSGRMDRELERLNDM